MPGMDTHLQPWAAYRGKPFAPDDCRRRDPVSKLAGHQDYCQCIEILGEYEVLWAMAVRDIQG